MSTKQVFKIAVMGAGLIGRRHVERVLAEKRTSLVAVIDPSLPAGHLPRRSAQPGMRILPPHCQPDGLTV